MKDTEIKELFNKVVVESGLLDLTNQTPEECREKHQEHTVLSAILHTEQFDNTMQSFYDHSPIFAAMVAMDPQVNKITCIMCMTMFAYGRLYGKAELVRELGMGIAE